MAAGLTTADEPGRWRRLRGRRIAVLALLLAVVAGHALLIVALHRSVVGWGADEAAPQRLEVAFVRALTPSQPVARSAETRPGAAVPGRGAPATKGVLQVIDSRATGVASASAHRPPRRAAADRNGAASSAASSSDDRRHDEHATHRDRANGREAAVASATAASSAAAAPSAAASAAHAHGVASGIDVISSAASSPASGPQRRSDAGSTSDGGAAPAADEGSGTAFATGRAPSASAPANESTPSPPQEIWPPSTRLSYTLTGNYRGAIGGTARVQWVRVGSHYQVQMDVTVGLPFAPLMTRRVTSDGEITEAGLQPTQFDELTKRAFQEPTHAAIHFADNLARMSNGLVAPAPPGTQDSVSQFVQLTWLFTLHPELLQPGHSVTIPLALRGRVQPWTYDVLGTESLYTVFGDVPVVHVKPRPVPGLHNVLGIEIWFAPTLQYLPARILVRENAETYIDLVLHELPLQAVAPAASDAVTGTPAHPPAGRPAAAAALAIVPPSKESLR